MKNIGVKNNYVEEQTEEQEGVKSLDTFVLPFTETNF